MDADKYRYEIGEAAYLKCDSGYIVVGQDGEGHMRCGEGVGGYPEWIEVTPVCEYGKLTTEDDVEYRFAFTTRYSVFLVQPRRMRSNSR
jgi:hypothetical protein